MANEFIVKNGLISQGNVTVSGSISTTSPLNLSGSLNIDGNIIMTGSRSIQTVTGSANTKGPTLTLLGGNGGSSSGAGGDIVLKGGNGINPSNVGGDVYIQGGDRTGGQRSGYIYIGAQSGQYNIYLQGTPTFTWDGPNAAYATIFQRGGATRFSIYDDVNLNANYYFYGGATTINAIWSNWKSTIVRGSGTTSATTAFQVQNANASASLSVLDNGSSTILSSAETGLTIQHTNGNYTSITNGNGSALASGQMGMYFNGTPMWTWNGSVFRLPGNILSTANNPVTLQIFGGWGGSTVGTSLRLGSNTGNGGVFTATSGTQSTVEIGNASNETWSPSSGNATYNLLNLVPRFNTTGTYSGISRGLYYAPTLTSITGLTHRAIETVTGDVLFGTTSGNVGIGTTTPASRLTVSGSAGTGSAIYAYKSGSTVLDIQGSQGQLFSVIDALSGSLMSVNDVSGLPILEVFSDDRVVMGTYGAPALTVSGSAVTVATASAAPSGTVPEGTFRFATVGGAYYIYAYLGGAWRSGSLF